MGDVSRSSIVLKRSIDIQRWRFQGEVGFLEKREELLSILLRVKENPETDSRDIAEHLLFEVVARVKVAERLLSIAEYYGLLIRTDSGFQLTSTGEEAIEREEVFVPQQGDWEIWASDDPMMESSILRLDSFKESKAYEETQGKLKDKAENRVFEEVPMYIRNAMKMPISPIAGKAMFRVEDIARNGESVALKGSDRIDGRVDDVLNLEWTVNDGGLRVRGSLGGNAVDAEMSVLGTSYDEVWKELLSNVGLLSQWDALNNALRVTFSETDDDERESCLRALYVERPFLDGLGEFEDVLIKNVALRASSVDEATIWADHRLRSRIRDYATERRFITWTEEAVKPFGEFNGLRLPASRRDRAQQAWSYALSADGERPSPFTWHLVAAEDWSL
ncbi:hypothetical protein [Lautropia mirabilis]|uniref:hypothetical protein n=1 Tax=Lautropia mirabilis TaxID=47671 RepID=UPI0028E4A34D|nr:hypothetical protein [Lautropia mirabilis]